MPGTVLRCEQCHHPWSLHSSGKSECKATGCSCPRWKGQTLMAVKTFSVAEAREATGKSEIFLRRHADKLGGKKVPRSDLGLGGGGYVLRFEKAKLDARLGRLERKLDHAQDT